MVIQDNDCDSFYIQKWLFKDLFYSAFVMIKMILKVGAGILVIFSTTLYTVRNLFAKFLLALFRYCNDSLKSNELNEEYDEDKIGNEEDCVTKCDKTGNGKTKIIKRTACLVPQSALNDIQLEKVQLKNINFYLNSIVDHITTGIEAVIEDQVVTAFNAEIFTEWNLLTRNRRKEHLPLTVRCIWILGILVRYAIFFPIRMILLISAFLIMAFSTMLIGYLPNGKFKRDVNNLVVVTCSKVMCSTALHINFHNPENRCESGICVANHTSPLDVTVLMCDRSYSLTGQKQGGFFGMAQKWFSAGTAHIWFERFQIQDRSAIINKMKEHSSDPNNPPILIFPEATCVNNTACMLFKKGAFEVGCPVYPIAIKYDPRFTDLFFNSSKHLWSQQVLWIATGWLGVCDVWYLPPMRKMTDESTTEFASRVQKAIAKQAQLVDLVWDGSIKHVKPKAEWKQQQQKWFCFQLVK